MAMRHPFRYRWALAALVAAGCAAILGAGCTNKSEERRPSPDDGTSAPKPEVATSRPMVESPATRPATQPASRPATQAASRPVDDLPPSTFSTEPPYTVQLHVRKPEDKQPGWLKVLEFLDKEQTASAGGSFPEHNRIEVATVNVARLQIELGYLPLAERRRVVLHIDEQGIEITQRDRKIVTLRRSSTGKWEPEKPARDD